VKNIDLETFYSRARTSLEIASSYVGNKAFKKLVVSCRLKPITIFDDSFRAGRLEYWWVDEFGNSLLLADNKIKIVKNDQNIKINTKISTDLFYGKSILATSRISKSIALSGDHLVFYGNDEYFRCFDVTNGEKISPLEIDINELIDVQRGLGGSYRLPSNEIEMMLIKEYSRYE
jgi:hypothetical protein